MAAFNRQEQLLIQTAITNAEMHTSGLLRVCIEKNCNGNAISRAAKYFYLLDMHKTRLRNGVLIYVATVDRKFAIIGDTGINKNVAENFWDDARDEMLKHFKFGNIVDGIVTGLQIAGACLQKFFPAESIAENQLLDEGTN